MPKQSLTTADQIGGRSRKRGVQYPGVLVDICSAVIEHRRDASQRREATRAKFVVALPRLSVHKHCNFPQLNPALELDLAQRFGGCKLRLRQSQIEAGMAG
jgi:hypothetical protein